MAVTRRGLIDARPIACFARWSPRAVHDIHRTSGRLEPGDFRDEPLDRGGDLRQRGRAALGWKRRVRVEIVDHAAQIISDLLARRGWPQPAHAAQSGAIGHPRGAAVAPLPAQQLNRHFESGPGVPG